MLSVLEKCNEENNEEASLLLESAPVEGFLKNAIQFNSSNMLVPVEGLTFHCNLQFTLRHWHPASCRFKPS